MKIGMTIFNNQTFFHKLFGIGPDSMSFYLYDKNNIFLYSDLLQAFDNQILTNAHCDYITVLINTGILGLISYLGLLIHSMRLFLNNKHFIIQALGFSIFAYTIYNIFSFQQFYNTTHLFIILGIGNILIKKDGGKFPPSQTVDTKNSTS